MGRGSFISASDQRNEPCSRRAIAHGGCNSQFPPADPAAGYRLSTLSCRRKAMAMGPSIFITEISLN